MVKIVLVGAGASGKDHFASMLMRKGATKSVSYTTRDIREGEVNGVDYHFISVEEFKKKIDSGFWYEWDLFRPEKEWYYGQSKLDMIHCDLFIKTVTGVSKIKPEDREKFTIFYLDIPEEIRRERLNERKDRDDPERRLDADRKDFGEFTDFDVVIKNFDF